VTYLKKKTPISEIISHIMDFALLISILVTLVLNLIYKEASFQSELNNLCLFFATFTLYNIKSILENKYNKK
jgi:hypothetical protein